MNWSRSLLLDIEIEEARKAAAVGYAYKISKLTIDQLAECSFEHLWQYRRGIIDGGSLDCLFEWHVLPHRLYDRLQSVC